MKSLFIKVGLLSLILGGAGLLRVLPLRAGFAACLDEV